MRTSGEYLAQMVRSRRTTEVRMSCAIIPWLRAGDSLPANGRYPYVIRRLAQHGDSRELLRHVDPATIMPHTSPDELLATMRRI